MHLGPMEVCLKAWMMPWAREWHALGDGILGVVSPSPIFAPASLTVVHFQMLVSDVPLTLLMLGEMMHQRRSDV